MVVQFPQQIGAIFVQFLKSYQAILKKRLSR